MLKASPSNKAPVETQLQQHKGSGSCITAAYKASDALLTQYCSSSTAQVSGNPAALLRVTNAPRWSDISMCLGSLCMLKTPPSFLAQVNPDPKPYAAALQPTRKPLQIDLAYAGADS
eukprot:GHUV01046654.1.p1 GENE.GHUV01046654.1~~GHUV01046654.1.p1  ORF type:complete len:117 (+),score=44.67 GHUV01046654.1:22-372(+)